MTYKTKQVLVILSYGLISMSIGHFFQSIMCPECVKDPMAVIHNIGYSVMLGYGLFFNKYIYDFWIEPLVSWLKKPLRSLGIAFGITTLYSAFVIFFTNWFWFKLIQEIPFGTFLKYHKGIWVTEFVILYFISMWFYARAFFMDWKKEFKERERFKREALSAKYDVLKSQVNPHFLFNSLNVAGTLIDKDTSSAKKFLSQLSGMYRDILELQEDDLVPLQRELKLAERYLYLQEMRFGKAFHFELPSIEQSNSFLIVPLSIQILMENAFKHNRFSSEAPMKIKVDIENEHLVVYNSIYAQSQSIESLNIGIENIKGRYSFLTGEKIEILNQNGIFEVRMPLVKDGDKI
ncbi:sensor histidine kinase [Marinilabilia rubra]|uniref:Histidine kinase n=1 Tax=Marinilabilia rubra TaxID=2162893 RepID=A0A2U2BAN7_9BACT|nr:sensor histidine kinase [Marinilabilia rubra]PWE00103.1 histidine kinase [Marinilabilia rubra]